jgi:hypothetical protein
VAVSAFVIAAMFFALAFFRISALAVGVGYVMLVGGFVCIVLAGLFKKAVEFKDENDLTV